VPTGNATAKYPRARNIFASRFTIAIIPNVQNDALTMRRYSSIPLPMTRIDLVRNVAIDDSHNAANKTENSVTTSPW
jgi:hypothetical protein